MTRADVLVIGGGLRGMRAALCAKAARPEADVLCVEAAATPGDDVQSQRSNGFVCELGPFAFTREEVEGWLEPLRARPRVLPAATTTGWLFDGQGRRELRVEPEPLSFATGCEEVVQSYRRQLGDALRLGRRVLAVRPREDGAFTAELGGEVRAEVVADEVVLATSAPAASAVLDPFEPELAQVAARTTQERRAYVWLGCVTKQAPELTGYGVVPHPSLTTPCAEMIFCSRVFPNRAMPERTLVRVELAAGDLAPEDPALEALAEQELRRWTETAAPFGFRKTHRFSTLTPDGDATECHTRVAEIVTRFPGLSLAP